MSEDGPSEADPSARPLERSVSQHSAASARSRRSSARHASKTQHMPSQPSSSASSIVASDKSLTSFPSFSPESPAVDRFDESQPKPDDRRASSPSARAPSIVDSLAAPTSARDALFEDPPLRQSFPGALNRADDGHIERLVARHGPVAVIRQIAEDLAQRDDQIANLRRRTDERERALRRIIRECGLTNLDLESRLRAVEKEMRATDRPQAADGRLLSHLMSDAMRDTVLESAYGETDRADSTIRANSASLSTSTAPENNKSTTRGWKGYFWGAGTVKKTGRTPNANSHGSSQANTTVLRSSSGMERRPTLQENLFDPPSSAGRGSETHVTTSRASSIHSTGTSEHKPSVSLASLALRLVAGSTTPPGDADARGRTASAPGRATSARSSSKTSTKTVPSSRATSVNSDPKALMAMLGSQMASRRAPSHAKSQLSEARGLKPAIAASGHAAAPPQENYGPVEMDAILPPGSQPPTLTMRNTYATDEYLTDRFGFIYDQRRKKRQREAAQTIQHMRSGNRAEMLMNGLSVKPSNLPHDAYSGNASTSSDSRPQSPGSAEEPAERRGPEEGRMKRWHDYLRIATFPTELLSHTPSINTPALVVMEGANPSSANELVRSPAITPTVFGLVPPASTTTAVNSVAAGQPSETGITTGTVSKEDAEPVRLLLEQLSDMHDALQRDKTVKWNDFLRKVRAERRREGEAAAAAAAAAAEARCEVPAMILPENRVADGEMIGISDLGNKGKVGRAKWHEFKALVLAGIPVAQRSKIWSECSGANGLRVPGVYEGLVSQAGDDDDPNVVGQIRMDIHRTLTDNIFFRKGPGVQKLSELLLAYSRRNKEVGYCQGMNLIAANLLLMMPTAEDAFWVMASMIENILPEGYYDHLLMPSRADQQVLRQYVSTVLPKLSAHLDTLSIELEALTFQWFLSVFTDCLCAEALFRVWDVVLCTNDGSTFLFQVALALLKLNETNLLLCDTPAEVYTYINHQMTEHAISIDGLLQASEGLRRVVRRDEVERRRAKAMQADRDLMMQRNGGWGRNDANVAEVTTGPGNSSGAHRATTEPVPATSMAV